MSILKQKKHYPRSIEILIRCRKKSIALFFCMFPAPLTGSLDQFLDGATHGPHGLFDTDWADWLFGFSIDWLIGRLIFWFVDWLIDFWIRLDWLIVWLVHCSSIDWSFDWFTVLRLIDWLIGWSTDWFVVVAETLKSPIVSKQEKRQLLQQLAKEYQLSPLTLNAFAAMTENGRLGLLSKLVKTFDHIMSAERGEVLVTVTTAQPLDASQEQSLKQVLDRFTKKGQQVKVEKKVDPAIIGGMIVSIGDKYVDMSTAAKIKLYSKIIEETVWTRNIFSPRFFHRELDFCGNYFKWALQSVFSAASSSITGKNFSAIVKQNVFFVFLCENFITFV